MKMSLEFRVLCLRVRCLSLVAQERAGGIASPGQLRWALRPLMSDEPDPVELMPPDSVAAVTFGDGD